MNFIIDDGKKRTLAFVLRLVRVVPVGQWCHSLLDPAPVGEIFDRPVDRAAQEAKFFLAPRISKHALLRSRNRDQVEHRGLRANLR